MLWTMLFIIPGIVKSLSYSMAALIQHDNPTLTASQVLNLSQRITKGYKGSLFLMELSFLGWYLLGAVTFGIAYLYVHPYLYTTQAMYYELLRQNALDRGIASPWEFGMVPNNAFSPYGNAKNQPPIGGKRTRAGMQTMAGIKTITASVGTTRLSIPRVHGKMMRIFGIQTGDPANENRKLRSGFQRGNPLLSITQSKIVMLTGGLPACARWPRQSAVYLIGLQLPEIGLSAALRDLQTNTIRLEGLRQEGKPANANGRAS